MRVIHVENINIHEIVEALKNGKTIVYPTETCYGLGCDATNDTAVQKVFAIKQRQQNKSVLVVAPDVHMMMEYVQWNSLLTDLAEKYWPGPLTVVANLKGGVHLSAGVTGEGGTLAFRITNYPLASELSRLLEKPIVSTSANIAAEESPYDIASVLAMFDGAENQPDIVIDAGTLPRHSPSTVVRVLDGRVEVLRQGEVAVE
ncbi:MAG: L-threonylcarbamoyladenylate synthase [Candidatus Magasanikbacteria bacterium]